MTLSNATITPANVVLTPMRVTFNGVDLGGTKGGVSFSPKVDMADIMVDQYGKTVIDKVVSGYAPVVKFTLCEADLKDNWKVALPFSKLVNNSGTKSMYTDMQIGDKLSNHTAILLLHPLSKSDADLSGDFKFFKAASIAAVDVKYGPDAQIELAVEMVILPDITTTPARFWIHGDPSNGLVAATAGGPAFTGTGNGTCTSVSTGSATKTETITLTCLGAPAANKSNWGVSGSVSGPLGTVAITSSSPGGTGVFTNNAINFTLTDGTTDFVAGDVFTIATVAANYS